MVSAAGLWVCCGNGCCPYWKTPERLEINPRWRDFEAEGFEAGAVHSQFPPVGTSSCPSRLACDGLWQLCADDNSSSWSLAWLAVDGSDCSCCESWDSTRGGPELLFHLLASTSRGAPLLRDWHAQCAWPGSISSEVVLKHSVAFIRHSLLWICIVKNTFESDS